jgi:hypothetical protein
MMIFVKDISIELPKEFNNDEWHKYNNPTDKQKNDPEVLKLIQMRSSLDSVYGDN